MDVTGSEAEVCDATDPSLDEGRSASLRWLRWEEDDPAESWRNPLEPGEEASLFERHLPGCAGGLYPGDDWGRPALCLQFPVRLDGYVGPWLDDWVHHVSQSHAERSMVHFVLHVPADLRPSFQADNVSPWQHRAGIDGF